MQSPVHIVGAVIITPSDLPGLMYSWENLSKEEHFIREGLDSYQEGILPRSRRKWSWNPVHLCLK